MEKNRYSRSDILQVRELLIILCALTLFAVGGVYMVLAFADAIDGEIDKGKVQRERFVKMMAKEQADLNAVQQIKEVTP